MINEQAQRAAQGPAFVIIIWLLSAGAVPCLSAPPSPAVFAVSWGHNHGQSPGIAADCGGPAGALPAVPAVLPQAAASLPEEQVLVWRDANAWGTVSNCCLTHDEQRAVQRQQRCGQAGADPGSLGAKEESG